MLKDKLQLLLGQEFVVASPNADSVEVDDVTRADGSSLNGEERGRVAVALADLKLREDLRQRTEPVAHLIMAFALADLQADEE